MTKLLKQSLFALALLALSALPALAADLPVVRLGTTFILNNNKVLLKNSRRNDVIDVNQNKVFKEIARIMMNSVVGKCLADEKDFKTQITTVGQEWVATLQPLRKDMKQMFQQIILHFDRKQSVVAVVELLEKNGDRTVIELKDIRKNEPISSDLFTVD